MAGLFAWAADVVGGGNLDNEESRKPVPLLLTPQQSHYLSELDVKAAALQQTVLVLRQRVGPGAQGFAERMPHLHADSVAAQSALALEVQAHNATRLQIQTRENSLRAENEAYAKEIAARQDEAREKEQEAKDLQISLQEIEKKEKTFKNELEKLRAAVEKKDELSVQEEEETIAVDGDRDSLLQNELKQLRSELEMWEVKTKKLETEVASAQQKASRWPSPAQREKDLERKLRNLTEQLVTKQAQAESLASERNALELRLEQLNEARRHMQATGTVDAKRNKIGRPSTSYHSADDSKARGLPVRQRASKTVTDNVASVARTVDAFSLHAGSHLWRNKVLRSLTVAYILGLHIAAFIILTGRLHRQFRPATTKELP
ncbi:hypothetical protein R1flu_015003 [Riccia fluitans]|uniref:Protein CASP n=1 Tax=Riccia fluitans TaxID=41844 RepID=A0ABD1YHU3_9MARC